MLESTLDERFAAETFALDMAGLRCLAHAVFQAALDGARVEMPPWPEPQVRP